MKARHVVSKSTTDGQQQQAHFFELETTTV